MAVQRVFRILYSQAEQATRRAETASADESDLPAPDTFLLPLFLSPWIQAEVGSALEPQPSCTHRRKPSRATRRRSTEEMAPGSESQAVAVEDPSCPPFPLLDEEDGGHIHEQEQEVPRGPELELPTVDLEAPGEALAAACRGLGVFRLANHGVPAALSARLFAAVRGALAGAPFHDKRAQPGYFWGTPALSLRVRDVNWVEGFHVALGDHGHHQPAAPRAPPLGDLFDLAAEYGAHMARVARALFDALAAPLGLGAAQAAAYLAERDGFLRVYRYPRCPEPGRLGMEAHTDSSVLSIINQDAVGGLQVLHDGAWRDVAPGAPGETGTLLVNLGDMARAISGDAYCSVRHRVAVSQTAERLSLCYFAFPRDDAVISCAGGRYRPFTYSEFREQVQADIKATGSKVGLERFLCRH